VQAEKQAEEELEQFKDQQSLLVHE